ncbi:hemicentin-1-like, partial [Centruroides sculpturatus]|uniref:hemicentin-1-like n=1 Tax=Centruroides sculpturatus TaxID=218467 RepID=UPI000C6D32B2
RPNLPTILYGGREYRNGSSVGPFIEGTIVTFHCTTIGGKPIPEVSWWKKEENLPEESTLSENEMGINNVTSRVKFQLMREDLGAVLECRVENDATETPLVAWIRLDLDVKPFALELEEQPVPVIEGEHAELICIVDGAKPPASVKWYNGSEIVAMSSSIQEEGLDDGTFRTISRLILPLSRYDHLKTIICKASNPVMSASGDQPLEDTVRLQVLYSPSVIVGPSARLTVNETGSAIINCTFDANPPNATEVIWYRNNTEININTTSRYKFNNFGIPSLIINFISRNDAGMYSCAVNNSIGRNKALEPMYMNVIYRPTVRARISPTQVPEDKVSNVNIQCDIIDGNPANLLLVRWYKDNKLMNEATSKEIRWLNVTRKLTGNYSCQGQNEAGWGNISEPVQFVVNYLPGKAKLHHLDRPAVKGKHTTLSCEVDDLGSPEATAFHWEYNGKVLLVTTANYTIDRVSLNSRGNYSCAAKNTLGIGQQEYYILHPKAPPVFIERPPSEYGASQNDSSISISCRVECFPMCKIEWLKNGASLKDSKMYIIKSTEHPEEVEKNTFPSMVSTLTWNLAAWPGGVLDRELDNAYYTCTSSGNDVGHGVSTATYFRVEFPPENITLSNYELSVVEGHVYAKVHCSAHSWPPSTYLWKVRETVIADTATLVINYTIPRDNTGIYICIASNRRGNITADLTVNVLYKPDCILSERISDEGRPIFTCEAVANPDIVNFTWFRQNETLHEHIVSRGTKSVLTLPANKPEYDGDYYCKVNNSVGESDLCHVLIQTTLEPQGWMPQLTEENVILIAGVASAIVIITIIVAAVMVLRNRRTHSEYDCRVGEKVEPQGWMPQLTEENVILIAGVASAIVIITIIVAAVMVLRNRRTHKNPISNFSPEGRVQPSESIPVNKTALSIKPSVVTFRRVPDFAVPKSERRDVNNPTKGKAGGSKPVYQNVTTGKKDSSESTAKYENMTFHQKDPRRPKTPIPSVRMRTALPVSHVYENISRLKHSRPLSSGATVVTLGGDQQTTRSLEKTSSNHVQKSLPSLRSQHGDESLILINDNDIGSTPLKDKENNNIKVEYTLSSQAKMKTNPEGVVYADLMLPNHGRSLVGRKGSCTEYATLKFEKEENGTPESLQSRRQ